jgi:hypothetical protein
MQASEYARENFLYRCQGPKKIRADRTTVPGQLSGEGCLELLDAFLDGREFARGLRIQGDIVGLNLVERGCDR